jgi:hypothetical protein
MTAVLLALFGYGKIAAQAIGSWLSRRSLGEIVGLALGLLLLLDHAALLISHRENGKLKGQITKCAEGRAADRVAYTKAQADAAALNEAQIQRVKSEQQRITDETVSTLDARIELIRNELRKQQAPTAQHAPGGPQTGNTSPAPCTVTDPAWMCLSPAERLSAAENEERHDELIDWVLKQSSIDPNTGAAH